MSSLSLRLPESLHKSLRKIYEKDHVSINQFITTAIAEKISALETEDYLRARGEQGNKNDFLQVLEKVHDREPFAADR